MCLHSPLSHVGIEQFPSDYFFVMRTCQLLRGLKDRLELDPEWSCAQTWLPLARKAAKAKTGKPAVPLKLA